MMRPVPKYEATPIRYVIGATLLLVGVLGVGYGYFNDSRGYLFAGVLLIVASVLSIIVDMLTGKGRN